MTVNHDVAGSSPAGGANKKKQVRNRVPVSFCFLSLFRLNQQDIMIAQLVCAEAIVCEANLPLSVAKPVAWFTPTEPTRRRVS